MKDVQLGSGGPPGQAMRPIGRGAEGWRAVTRVLRSSGGLARQAMLKTGGAVWTGVADLTHVVMPSDCRLCGGAMVSLGKVRVCKSCVALVGVRQAGRDEAVCSRCGDAMGFESARMMAAMGLNECTMCRLAPPEFERAVAAGNYDDEMREMLHLLKFAGRRGVAEMALGERLATAMVLLEPVAAREVVVVPVPLFAAREHERGYNQALLLARSAVKRVRRMKPEWGLRVETGVLLRVKDTRSLYTLTRKQRTANLRGAFRVAKAASVVGREVLLVDDIMTTGSTARECARVLMRAGAAKVWVATAAKVQPQGSVAVLRETDVAAWSVGGESPTSQKRDVEHPDLLVKKFVKPDVSRQRKF